MSMKMWQSLGVMLVSGFHIQSSSAMSQVEGIKQGLQILRDKSTVCLVSSICFQDLTGGVKRIAGLQLP